MGHVSPGETSGFRPRRDRSIARVVVGISLSQQLNTRNLVPHVGPGSSSLVNILEKRVKVQGPGRDASDKERPGGECEYIRMLENDSS